MNVLFTIDGNNQFSVLNNLTSILDNAFEEIWKKMSLSNKDITPYFLFGQGHWPTQSDVYFEIRISYRIELRKLVFQSINMISNIIESNIKGD